MSAASAFTLAWERLFHKRAAYKRTFCGSNGKPTADAQIVLDDLRKVCGIERPGIVVSPVSRTVDPMATAYRAGMRDVYMRVAGYLDLENVETLEERYERATSNNVAR